MRPGRRSSCSSATTARCPTFEQARTGGLRGSKLSLYEGGIRVPCIAWGRAWCRPGVTNETTVLAAVDLFPTLCKLARRRPAEGLRADGEDLSAALLGRPPRSGRSRCSGSTAATRASFAYPDAKHRSPNVAVRDGDWKLLVNADGTGAELYDLAADPKETPDRAAPSPSRQATDRRRPGWRKSLPERPIRHVP